MSTPATNANLTVRLPNWVGDVCMALPALQALQHAGADMCLIGKGWAKDLLSGHSWPVVKAGPDLAKSLAEAHQRQVEVESKRYTRDPTTVVHQGPPRWLGGPALLLTNSFSSAWQTRRIGLRPIGHRGDFRRLLLHRSLARPPKGLHEVESFWRLAVFAAQVLGLPPLADQPPAILGLRLSSAHHLQAATALATAGISSPYVVLCPLAVGTIAGKSKVWPSFPLLCRVLREQNLTVVACPGPGEEPACQAALPGAILLPGLGLGAYAAVLHQSQLVIANDSGPMHLAAAVQAPVLGIFGAADPDRTRPWSPLGSTIGNAQGWPGLEAVLEQVLIKLSRGTPSSGEG